MLPPPDPLPQGEGEGEVEHAATVKQLPRSNLVIELSIATFSLPVCRGGVGRGEDSMQQN